MATTTLRELVTDAPEATEAAGERLAAHVRRGDLLLLRGEMGAGKTTLVRGLARGLGSDAPVMSPTFQLVRVYDGPLPLGHVDLYRLAGPEAPDGAADRVDDRVLADLGLDELRDGGAVVVEWGERMDDPSAAVIAIDVLDERRRRLRIVEGPDSWSW